MQKLFTVLGGLALAVLGSGIASATSITSMPTIVDGGLTFTFGSNACVLTSGGGLSTPSSCSQVQVAPIVATQNIGNGLAITAGIAAAGNTYTDLKITYNLSSTYGISSIGLSYVGSILGQSIISISESVYNNTNLVGTATVSCAAASFGGGCVQSVGNVALNGSFTNMTVVKDIYLGATTGAATASAIYQTFATPTPEPVSLSLMAGGLVLFGAARFRRNRKA